MPSLCNTDDILLDAVTRCYGKTLTAGELRAAAAAIGLEYPATGRRIGAIEKPYSQKAPGERSPTLVKTSSFAESDCAESMSEALLKVADTEKEWAPPAAIAEAVGFIVMELRHTNTETQVVQMASLMRMQPPCFTNWLVHELLRHIPDMTNHLSTYYEFFVALCRHDLGHCMEQMMREETYAYVKKLLNRQNCIISGFNDRQVLKNLGAWIGFMTVAKDYPIFDRELNIRELLETALTKGDTALCVVVPFVTRIMRSCRLSLLLSPDSAWSRSIIRILVAIHRCQPVKMNIKFEVALLLRAFGMNIEDVETEDCLDSARFTERRLNFSGFPERFEGDPLESKLQLARDLGIPLIVAEKTLQFYKYNVDDAEEIVGVNEEAIAAANGRSIKIPLIETVNEVLCERRSCLPLLDGDIEAMQTCDGSIAFSGFTAFPDTNELPPFLVTFDSEPMVVVPSGDQSIDYMHCAEMLFYDLNQKYMSSSCAQIESFENLLEVISTYKEQGLLAVESAEPFLIACMQVYIQLCYTLNEEGLSSRHHCHFYADSLASIISLTAEELVAVSSEASEKFVGSVFSSMRKLFMLDFDSRDLASFLMFPYARMILASMWRLQNVCLRLKDSDLLFVFQRDMASLMMHLRPANLPCFAFWWLNIIGNHKIVWGFLSNPSHQGSSRAIFAHLLVTVLKFLAKIMGSPACDTHMCCELLQGMQRLIFYLHNFPDVLLEFYDPLCTFMPSGCVQLRNCVLSALPKGMRAPDPISLSPRSDYLGLISMDQKINVALSTTKLPFEADLLKFLESGDSPNLLDMLPAYLRIDAKEPSRFNMITVNSLVLVAGKHATEQLKARGQKPTAANVCQMPFADLFVHLSQSLCNEGRYVLFQTMSNQLRYPNIHTELYSQTLLHIFRRTTNGNVCEVMTRVMVERLVALAPHPWGLVRTFHELVSDKSSDFWNLRFVKENPELHKLLRKMKSTQAIGKLPFENELLHFLESRNSDLLVVLPYWLTSSSKDGSRFSRATFDSLILLIGKYVSEQLRVRGQRPTVGVISKMPFMDLLMHLAHAFCNEGRYTLFQAMVDQLRYPCILTELYSQTLFYMFGRTNNGNVCEVMARVMVERLVVFAPHPWGLVCTFNQIIRDPSCDFWSLQFVSKNPELQK
ncbi:hypothetical protein QR680_003550 [Steinernema hermaphroditum]|uniref:CCR4-Not complex component Not1 C-terminal domain-containing protein n=1 Tax=Steinernema hermaphroditum TaxID=289476 RepID=A0AA39LSG6_9BILA|nr:hypothetical protein QR680_003550 [Steinernema hermaphroditum]